MSAPIPTGEPIGHLDWSACEYCLHNNDEEGGCFYEMDEILANIDSDGDSIFCGLYESVAIS